MQSLTAPMSHKLDDTEYTKKKCCGENNQPNVSVQTRVSSGSRRVSQCRNQTKEEESPTCKNRKSESGNQCSPIFTHSV